MSCDCDYICDKEAVSEQHYSNCNSKRQRSPEGTVSLNNKHLQSLDVDELYHLGLNTSENLQKTFGDVKFVCLGGSTHRMLLFADYMVKILDVRRTDNLTDGKRYVMYKVGPVLSVSHGIGIPSMTVALQEVIKLMYYAKAKDPIFIRIGTSGGLSIPGGSVVVSTSGMSGTLKKAYEIPVLGKIMSIPAELDKRIAEEILFLNRDIKDFKTVAGVTMGADDFYRGQARLDGPFCHYTEDAKMDFLRTLMSLGVRNIEMEAPAFAAMTSEAGVRAAIVCVTLLNRLEGDQVSTKPEILKSWEERPMLVVSNLIKKKVEKKRLAFQPVTSLF